MAAVLLGQAEAVAAARRIFGDLLNPEPGHDPAPSPPPGNGGRRPATP